MSQFQLAETFAEELCPRFMCPFNQSSSAKDFVQKRSRRLTYSKPWAPWPCCSALCWLGCWPGSGTSPGPPSSLGWWTALRCPWRSGGVQTEPVPRRPAATGSAPGSHCGQRTSRWHWTCPPPLAVLDSSQSPAQTLGLSREGTREIMRQI